MEEIVNVYYANNAAKLHKVVDKIIFKFDGVSDKDKDDFYSLANEVFVDVIKRYDTSLSFEAFLYSCLFNKIKTEMTRRNREKRKADRMCISIDTPIGDEENSTLQDVLVGRFDLEREIFGEEDSRSLKVENYLSRLTRRQKRIVELLAESYGAGEVQRMLQITNKEYSEAMKGIRSYENISLLF